MVSCEGSRISMHELPRVEIMHYFSPDLRIFTQANLLSVVYRNQTVRKILPHRDWTRYGLPFRLMRRALRLDKCNAVPVFQGESLEAVVVIRQGYVYRFDLASGELEQTLKLRQCRNVLHQSICTTDQGYLYFGEYGHNANRDPVPVYGSRDGGRSWKQAYEFPAKSIKHVHGCYWDPLGKSVWVCTGDFAGENQIVQATEDFSHCESYGDGSQAWRTCYPFFFEDSIVWGMDSQLETSYLCVLDRRTKTVGRKCAFPGPIWYGKRLEDGVYLMASTNEIGPGVLDRSAHLFASRNGIDWTEVLQVRKDFWPKRYFKFGVLGFADGPQTSTSFAMFGEALSGMDGRTFLCSLEA